MRELFRKLYSAPTEGEVDELIHSHPNIFCGPENWHPYGDSESFFGVIENQQASPIPALVEKITNSIDAILMRACMEQGIDPRSKAAPRTISAAREKFFPDHKNWDLSGPRSKQAERIQILADGPRGETSLIIYDDGEGQHPDDFESTFLSLLRGNKNEIHFVQGKYNMGGAGALIFCGKKRYQLIGSRRYDGSGPFGFTLLRRHPLSKEEQEGRKNTWYEYFRPGGKIPSFPIDELNIGLYKRSFKVGTVIKLYSYELPPGARSVISRDLNQSINEYLFEPALPLYTIDAKERYPKDINLERSLYGLKRRLEQDDNKYVEDTISFELKDQQIGHAKGMCYVFRPRLEGKTVRETKDTIRREFFKNNMTVLFSMNGQVHGHYTSEFVSRTLKMSLLKDYLLIHLDCSGLHLDFRNELFMASRDRLKAGEESNTLRQKIAEHLKKTRLKELYRHRRAAGTMDAGDATDLLKAFSKDLPLQNELRELLKQTFQLDGQKGSEKATKKTAKEDAPTIQPFQGKRFPTKFKIDSKKIDSDGTPVVKLPQGTERTVRFHTDVEDSYFDRVEEPGQLTLAVLDYKPNETSGGDQAGLPKDPDNLLDVATESPEKGTIRITLHPTGDLQVGDALRVRATLAAPEGDFEEIFLVKIVEPSPSKSKGAKDDMGVESDLPGLPPFHLVYREASDGRGTWDTVGDQGIEMNHATVMHPVTEGEKLEAIYINMDSHALLEYKSTLKGAAEIEFAEKRYISSVYFHALFLYTITRRKKYALRREVENGDAVDVELGDYLSDLFASYYSQFLLKFGAESLIPLLED